MPSSLTYPGVYIEEIPSGVRTITGVATSIAAFIGWAPRGPTDRAELLLSWSDFERTFGGLDKRSLLGYAVSALGVACLVATAAVLIRKSPPSSSVSGVNPWL